MEPKVIAETEDILVLNKTSGLIVHSDGRTEEPSVAQWVGEKYPALRGIGGDWVSPQGERVALNGIVHRLDRTTSGILLVAKTQEMFEYLKNEFRERRVEKKYLAYVYGEMESAEGTIVAEIMRSPEKPRRWYARACESSDTRAAVTQWRVLGKLHDDTTGESVSYLELTPKTGRTHQLRVHLASVGHAIVSDTLYAPEMPPLLGFARPALHASAVSFTLPSGARATFEAPLPPDFPKR